MLGYVIGAFIIVFLVIVCYLWKIIFFYQDRFIFALKILQRIAKRCPYIFTEHTTLSERLRLIGKKLKEK